MTLSRITKKRHWFLNALLATAFLCHAMTPAGFMPGPFGLMLCPDYGASPAAVAEMAATHAAAMHMAGMGMSHGDMLAMHADSAAANAHHEQHAEPAGHNPPAQCVFAAATGGIAPPMTAGVALVETAVASPNAVTESDDPASLAVLRSQRARAPPLLSMT